MAASRSKLGMCAASAIVTNSLPGIDACTACAALGGVDASLSPTTTVAGHAIRPATSEARVSRKAAAHPA